MARLSVWSLMRSDHRFLTDLTGRNAMRRLYPQLTASVLHRLAHAAHLRGVGVVAWALNRLNFLLTGAEIEHSASFGPGLALVHTSGIVVAPNVVAGRNLALWGGVVLGEGRNSRGSGAPVLGDDVQVYAKASVLGPVLLGDRVRVGAHGVCVDDVPDDGLVVGVPARPVER